MTNDLGHLVEEINGRDAPALVHLVDRLLSDPSTLDEISRLAATLGVGDGRSATAIGLDAEGIQIDPAGANAFISVLSSHPTFTEGRRLDVAVPIVGPADDDPALVATRRDAAELLAMGALSIGMLGLPTDYWVDGLTGVAMGPEAFSTVLRRVLTGKPLPDPEVWWDIPDWIVMLMEELQEIDRRTCVLGLNHALNDVAQASQGLLPRAFATGITGLAPSIGCDGSSVTIQGSGFGPAQPQDVDVYFPGRTGSCLRAKVTSWSDTAIVATAPTGVGTGCVGFVLRGQGTGDLVSATETLAGEMERCIGMAASAVAYKLRHATLLGIVTCPPCLPSRANEFRGGFPSIGHFAANGGTEVTVEPGDTVTLSWGTGSATSLSIAHSTSIGPFTTPPSPLPTSGSLTLGTFTGSQPETATYKLTATNNCGAVTRTVTVHLRKLPRLTISAIEVVQVIQRPGNTVRLVQGKLTSVRVFVESGVTGGFDYGSGPDVMPDVTGRVIAFPAGAGQGFDLGPPWGPPGTVNARPAGTMNRNIQSHSLNFDLPANLAAGTVGIDVHVAVKGHEGDIGGPYVAFSSTTVAFQTQPIQEVLPLLIADPLSGLAAPTLAQFFTSLGESIARFPISDTGFIVNPPILYSTIMGTSIRPLGSVIGWGLLLADLATLIFVMPSTPVGGIRAGVVPPGGTAYALNGMGTPRVAVSIPAFLSQVGLRGTFAHEMGHSIGLGHAPCPPPCPGGTAAASAPPSGIDGRLPGTTDDTGMEVAARTVIPLGGGELMSYCGDRSRCSGAGTGWTATRWPSTTTFDIIFGSLPI